MKAKKFKLILIVVSLVLLYFHCNDTHQKIPEHLKAKITYDGNTKVVKNPNYPLYGDLVFQLEKSYVITDGKILYHRPADIELDKDENLYLLDSKNCQICIFDKNGRKIRCLGRRGKGPSELESPYALFFTKNNRLNVHDRMRIKIFDNGSYLKDIILNTFFHRVSINDKGRIYGITRRHVDKENKKVIVILNEKGEIEKKIATFPYPKRSYLKDGDRYVSLFINHRYVPKLYMEPIDGNQFLYAHSSNYRIHRVNSDGNTNLIIEKEEIGKEVLSEELPLILRDVSYLEKTIPKKEIEEAIHLPKYRPFFNRLLVDDEGRIYTQKPQPYTVESETHEFDIFSKKGYFLYRLRLDFSPDIIRNGHVYDIFYEGETDSYKIRKFKVLNWEIIEK